MAQSAPWKFSSWDGDINELSHTHPRREDYKSMMKNKGNYAVVEVS